MKLKNSPYKKSKLFLQIDRDTNNNGSPFRKVISDSFKEARISSSPSPSTPCASSSIFKKYNTSKCPDILYDQTNEGNNSNLFELDDYNNSTTSCKLIGSRSNNTSASKVTLSSTVLLSNKENPDDISIDNDLPENLTLKTSNNYYYSNQSNYNDNNNYINNVNNNDDYIDIEKFIPSNLDDPGNGISAYKKCVDKLLDNKEKSDSLNLQVKSKG
ncbi:11684_t:CDS:2 [Entrophospora sp. SA101]|nr:11684_t:CDS:2 [Entrophospora sp. SA101]